MTSLPQEILLYIFNHVPQHDRLRLLLVCREWRTVALDHTLWRNGGPMTLRCAFVLANALGPKDGIPSRLRVDVITEGINDIKLARARGFHVANLGRILQNLHVGSMEISKRSSSLFKLSPPEFAAERMQNSVRAGLIPNIVPQLTYQTVNPGPIFDNNFFDPDVDAFLAGLGAMATNVFEPQPLRFYDDNAMDVEDIWNPPLEALLSLGQLGQDDATFAPATVAAPEDALIERPMVGRRQSERRRRPRVRYPDARAVVPAPPPLFEPPLQRVEKKDPTDEDILADWATEAATDDFQCFTGPALSELTLNRGQCQPYSILHLSACLGLVRLWVDIDELSSQSQLLLKTLFALPLRLESLGVVLTKSTPLLLDQTPSLFGERLEELCLHNVQLVTYGCLSNTQCPNLRALSIRTENCFAESCFGDTVPYNLATFEIALSSRCSQLRLRYPRLINLSVTDCRSAGDRDLLPFLPRQLPALTQLTYRTGPTRYHWLHILLRSVHSTRLQSVHISDAEDQRAKDCLLALSRNPPQNWLVEQETDRQDGPWRCYRVRNAA